MNLSFSLVEVFCCVLSCVSFLPIKQQQFLLRSHGDNRCSLTNVEMAAFSSNAKYRPCACVYHNTETPYLTKKKNQTPLPLSPVDQSYLDRIDIQTRGMSHKYQKYSQFHCSLPAEYIRRLRYCDYLGKYFCDCCHSYAQSSIPARILLKWDFKKYYVCNFSKHLLDSIWQHPIFNVSCINKALYTKSKEMDRVRVSVAFFYWEFVGLRLLRRTPQGRLSFAVCVCGKKAKLFFLHLGFLHHCSWDSPSFLSGEGEEGEVSNLCQTSHFPPCLWEAFPYWFPSFSSWGELGSCSKYLPLFGNWWLESSGSFELILWAVRENTLGACKGCISYSLSEGALLKIPSCYVLPSWLRRCLSVLTQVWVQHLGVLTWSCLQHQELLPLLVNKSSICLPWPSVHQKIHLFNSVLSMKFLFLDVA